MSALVICCTLYGSLSLCTDISGTDAQALITKAINSMCGKQVVE